MICARCLHSLRVHVPRHARIGLDNHCGRVIRNRIDVFGAFSPKSASRLGVDDNKRKQNHKTDERRAVYAIVAHEMKSRLHRHRQCVFFCLLGKVHLLTYRIRVVSVYPVCGRPAPVADHRRCGRYLRCC